MNDVAQMEAYINPMNSTAVLPVSSSQNSLHGALKIGSSEQVKRPAAQANTSLPAKFGADKTTTDFITGSVDQDMQRQLEEFNRSVTIIFWYKATMEPIRLQHMISTFPYFQLSRLSTLTMDLGLSATSYLDTYDPQSGKWEQHTINTVRLVETQQRLLYRIRRTLLEGLSEDDCLGLREEVLSQSRSDKSQISPSLLQKPSEASGKGTLKRSASESSNVTHASKLHITNGYYMAHAGVSSVVASSSNPAVAGSSPPPAQLPLQPSDASPGTNSTTNPAALPSNNGSYIYQSPIFYSTPTPTPPAAVSLPQYLTTPQSTAPPIPYHPHPPLKRWPNDYTVSELSAGFHAMEMLIAHSPSGASMTQRIAFERVFGSRYVKSTVCRHRGVWRKAPPLMREEFEAMGTDERACWGEFVRRIEGRPPGKMTVHMTGPLSAEGVVVYRGHSVGSTVQVPAMPKCVNKENGTIEEPVMDSLQNPDLRPPALIT